MLDVQIGDNMRKVTSHSHYVTGVMSEDASGIPADNSMHGYWWRKRCHHWWASRYAAFSPGSQVQEARSPR